MLQTILSPQEFLKAHPQFTHLSSDLLDQLANQMQFLRYRMGQAMMGREGMPAHIAILYQGQARLLGYDPRTQTPVTLKLLESGELFGWASAMRAIPCETILASTEVVCLILPIANFWTLVQREPEFAKVFYEQVALIELFDLLGAELARRADGKTDLKELAERHWGEVNACHLLPARTTKQRLSPDYLWLISRGSYLGLAVGSSLPSETIDAPIPKVTEEVRLVGIPHSLFSPIKGMLQSQDYPSCTGTEDTWLETVRYAPEYPPALAPTTSQRRQTRRPQYPYVAGQGEVETTLACFQMLAQHLTIPFRRDRVRKVLLNQYRQSSGFSWQFCGAVAEFMGLSTQLVQVSASTISRLQAPAMIRWQDRFAILYQMTDQEIVVAIPGQGITRQTSASFSQAWGQVGEVMLIKMTPTTPKQRFGLKWFLPFLKRYSKVLTEVLIASVFVQIFGLVNPLVTQVIIDKVLMQNSPDTLSILGIFLIVVAAIEALLTSLRTYLFVDTTNRIDFSLGTEVINHLLRLPLSYFERRPVGELATRIQELENIRQFLTGTALTVVLDALFSVVYILVMGVYSWQLTLVALATVPLFGLLTLIVSPIIRQQSRTKSEHHAKTQSYLVEVLSGMQTVKAQNLELRSRWQWQDRYAKYITTGFKTVITSTAAGAISGFLNKLSSLLVLWVGAYLVLKGGLTLGQLVAFRILAGYVTNPLLRLIQLWQNFQETALSLERLADVVDATPEVDEGDLVNIAIPPIQGSVEYHNVSFGFSQTGPLQLNQVNLNLPAGTFVGIVGQSGSGKSTLTKLLPRLYHPKSGQILIDGYDISKVELYSLRRQIGMVLQDTLLFEGTIQENIALTNPNASDEEIVNAAKIAFAHDFIMALPNGYNTKVGERGASLSGGQRQRIAIARTVLQNPQLLILDEATSALDYNAERQVCLNLAEAFCDRTVFFITHRLTTIRNADIILVMEQGNIAEQGTHAELMALKGRYYCLYQQQDAQL